MRKIIEKKYEDYASCSKRKYQYARDYQKLFDLINKKGVLTSAGPSKGYHYRNIDGAIDRSIYFLLTGTKNPVSIHLASHPVFSKPMIEVSIDDRFVDNKREKKTIESLCNSIKEAIK